MNEETNLDVPQEVSEPVDKENVEETEVEETSEVTSDSSGGIDGLLYDIEIYDEYCSSGDLLDVFELNACLQLENNERLDYFSDMFLVSFNIIIGLCLGYVAVRGLLDTWRN